MHKDHENTLYVDFINLYHTIGRHLALPTGTIRAGQKSPYFANYMQRANMDRANMTPYLPVFYFQIYSGDDRRHRFLNNCASTRTRTRSARKFIT
jgi:hypothetical protein